MKCAICKEDFDKSHPWKIHRIKLETYLGQYSPRFNKLTNQPIIFKSLDQYLTEDFDSKTELSQWIKQNKSETIKEYLIQYLIRRKQYKKLSYFPSQFESRTICFPSVSYIVKNWGLDYLIEISEKSGLPLRYTYSNIDFFDNKSLILVDTREQAPLFKNQNIIEIRKLDEGDYELKDKNQNICIDRKSLNDYIGTMSQGFERFERELQRAQDKKKFLIMLVESKYTNLASFNYLPAMRRVKATPDFIFHRVRELLNKYQNFQIVCVDGREAAEQFVSKALKIKTLASEVDFQYYIDNSVF